MKRHGESLLRPVACAVWWYLGLIVLRELVRIAGGYSLSATLRFLVSLIYAFAGLSVVAFLHAFYETQR